MKPNQSPSQRGILCDCTGYTSMKPALMKFLGGAGRKGEKKASASCLRDDNAVWQEQWLR